MRAILASIALAFLVSACVELPWMSSGTFIGAEDFNGYENLQSEPVKGRSCYFYLLIPAIGFGDEGISHAYADAMFRSPVGTTGLSNVEMHQTQGGTILVNWRCAVVTGTPAKRKQP